jgi:hypothetical protein
VFLVDVQAVVTTGDDAPELQEQAQRIEHLSKAEHDLLRELHPAVEEIQSNIEEVTTAVTDQMRSDPHR